MGLEGYEQPTAVSGSGVGLSPIALQECARVGLTAVGLGRANRTKTIRKCIPQDRNLRVDRPGPGLLGRGDTRRTPPVPFVGFCRSAPQDPSIVIRKAGRNRKEPQKSTIKHISGED